MDESETSWDELLKSIGAAPAPDALERRRPVIETRYDAPQPPASPAPTSAPASDWQSLARQLGLQPPPEPTPRAAAAPPAPAPPTKPAPLPRATGAEPTAREIEAGFASIEAVESEFAEVVEAEISDVEFSELEDSSLEGEDWLSGEAARDAFEALFVADADEAPAPPPPRPPQRRRGAGRGETPRRSREPIDDVTPLEPEPEATDEESAEDQPRPRRRRRRGGRGRGRRTPGDAAELESGTRDASDDGRTPAEDAPEEEFGFIDEGDGDESRSPLEEENAAAEESRGRSRRGRRRRGSRRSEEGPARRPAARSEDDEDNSPTDDADFDRVMAGGHDDDEGDDLAEKTESHKNIPSWSDAVSVCIDVNMAARRNSPARGASPRGRGRGRGGRGGRGGGRGGSRGGD